MSINQAGCITRSFLWNSTGSSQYFSSTMSKENRVRGWANTQRAKCEGCNWGHWDDREAEGSSWSPALCSYPKTTQNKHSKDIPQELENRWSCFYSSISFCFNSSSWRLERMSEISSLLRIMKLPQINTCHEFTCVMQYSISDVQFF